METTSGSRYDETQGETVPQLAQRMRADVAKLHADGVIPETLEVSVRSRHGSTIDIVVMGLRDADTWTDQDDRSPRNLTPAGRALFEALEQVHGAYDQSRSYKGQDYPNHRYYGGVTLLTEERQAWERKQRAERLAQSARAREARAAAQASPLRAMVKAGRPVQLVVVQHGDDDVEQLVAPVPLEAWRAQTLKGAEVEYLLGRAGWEVTGYVKKSKKNPVPYWTVQPTSEEARAAVAALAPTSAAPAPESHQPAAAEAEEEEEATPEAPAPALEVQADEAPAEAPAPAPRDKVAEAVAQLPAERIVQMLGKLSRRDAELTGRDATVCRALVAGLRAAMPAAFDAVPTGDVTSRAFLRELVQAAGSAPAQVEEEAAEDDWDGLEILHDAEHGTVLVGTRKGDGAYDALRAAGQRWRSLRWGDYEGSLYVQRTIDKPANRWFIGVAERALQGAGFKVRVRIDDTPRAPELVKAHRDELTDARVDRLSERAARAGAGSAGAQKRAEEIGRRFEFGQPILLDHHSGKGALRDQERMDGAMRTSVELGKKAEYLAAGADAAVQAAERRKRPLQAARRIFRAEAELRKNEASRRGKTRNFRNGRNEIVSTDVTPPASGERLEQLNGEAAHLESQLAGDRAELAEHVAAGRWRIVPIKEIKPGDWVWSDGWQPVESVGTTRVKIDAGPGMEIFAGIHEIGARKSAAEVAEMQRRRKAEKAAAAAEGTTAG
jgi:hypothetical protein